MDCCPQGFSVHEILQARILEWIAMYCLPDPVNPCLLSLLHWQVGSLPLMSPGKLTNVSLNVYFISGNGGEWTDSRLILRLKKTC